MPERHRLLDDKVTDAAVLVIMNVGAANARRGNLNQDVIGTDRLERDVGVEGVVDSGKAFEATKVNLRVRISGPLQ